MPKISVIVPLYNEERFITDTIHCLRAQTFLNFECIIVDDCSTDNSVKRAENAIDKDSRFRIIKNKINIKGAGTRNIGLLYASGKYIVFLDADDIISSTCLQERYDEILKYPFSYIAGSYSRYIAIKENETKYPKSTPGKCSSITFTNNLGDSPVVIHSPLTRRDIACGIGGFNEKLKNTAEDFEFWTQLLRHGFMYIPTHTINAFYREKKGSMVRSEADVHLSTAIGIFERNNSTVKLNSFFSIANIKMNKPAYEYSLEERYFNRIFRFLGMQIQSKIEINIDTLIYYIPTFHHNFPFIISAFELMQAGVKRADPTISENKILLKEYDLPIINILSKIKKATKKLEIENLNIEEVDIYSAEWQRQLDIAFIPHKNYHVETIKILQKKLEEREFNFVIADCSAIYKDEGVRTALEDSTLPHVSLPQLCFGDFSPKCIIVFNDWDKIVTRPAMEVAKKVGIIAMSIVEGIQDYDDADTERVRNAYKTCSHVITPCKFDMKYFDRENQYVYEGCIPRIAKLMAEVAQHPYNPDSPIVINSNFSYNVLVDKRDEWVKSVVEACEELGKKYVISKHPADLGDFSAYNVTNKSMYDAIWESSLFISRFGSGIIESLAMERPVLYYNPHNEKVDKFKDSLGAYYTANNKEELKKLILKTYTDIEKLKTQWHTFLELHAGFSQNGSDNMIQKILNALDDAFKSIQLPSQENRKKFGAYLSTYFHADDSTLFKNIKPLKNWQQ